MNAEPDRDLDKTVPPRRPPARRHRDTTSYAPPPSDGGTPEPLTSEETRAVDSGPLPRLDKFVIEEKIGEGGMGVVYRAYDSDLHRRVAIKKIHPKYTGDQDLSERFVSEARSIAAVTHPNIAQIFSIHSREGDAPAYFVMEYIDGESVEKRVERLGPLPVEEAVGIVIQAARGLRAAHRNGIVHRDVKPSNLVLNDRGLVKLVDFGLSQPVGEMSERSEKGVVLGTPHYVSPEQSRGWVVDHRADIYSLGCTLYYLLTAAPPFEADTQVKLLLAHASDPPPDLRAARPEATAELAEIVGQMLAKKATERFQEYDEVIHALRRVIEVEETAEVLTEPRSIRWAWLSTAILLSALILVAVLEGRTDPTPDPRLVLGSTYTRTDEGARLQYHFQEHDRIPPGVDAPTRSAGTRDSQPYELLGPYLRWSNFPEPLTFPFLREFQEIHVSALKLSGTPDFELRVGYDPARPTRYVRVSFGVGRNEEDVVDCILGGQKQDLVIADQQPFTIEENAEYNLHLSRVESVEGGPELAAFHLIIARRTENGEAVIVDLPFAVPQESVGPGHVRMRCENPLVDWSAYMAEVLIRGQLDESRIARGP